MNKLARKRADFQKLRGTTRRMNRLRKIINRISIDETTARLAVEIRILDAQIKTVKTGIVKEMLLKFQEILKRLYSEAKNA